MNSKSNDNDDNDDDPIVQEHDVYLNKQLTLYLLSYPLKGVDCEPTVFKTARIKPVQKELEFETVIDENINFSKSKAGEISDKAGNQVNLNKMTLKSDGNHNINCNKAVGYVTSNGDFIISPVSAILEMRPSLSYLNVNEKRVKTDNSNEEELDIPIEETISVKYARKESEAAKAKRLSSYDHHMKMRTKERWIEVDYRGPNSMQSKSERSLFEQNTDNTSLQQSMEWTNMNVEDYTKKILTTITEEAVSNVALPCHMLSLSQLRTLPLNEQVKRLLLQAKVMKFSQLQTLIDISGNVDDSALLYNLQQYGVLIQGCWVLKSELLYDENCKNLITVRDFVLLKFMQSRNLVRKEIASIVKISPDQLKLILQTVARSKGATRHWEFLMETDTDFIDSNPETVNRQQRQWLLKQQELQKLLGFDSTPQIVQRRRRNSSVKGDEPNSKSPKPRQRKKSNCKTDEENNIKMEDDQVLDCKTILSNFAKDLMTTRFVLLKSEIRNEFNKYIKDLPKIQSNLIGKITDDELEKYFQEIGGRLFMDSYVMLKCEDGRDLIRQSIIDIMDPKNMKVRIGLVKKRLKDIGFENINDVDCKKTLKEICTSKGSQWILKTFQK